MCAEGSVCPWLMKIRRQRFHVQSRAEEVVDPCRKPNQ